MTSDSVESQVQQPPLRSAPASVPGPRTSVVPSDPVWVAPIRRPETVLRSGLLDRLLSVETPPVIAVVAPAGYGKTTLLRQWAQSWGPRVAWVSAGRGDNDPAVLLAHLVAAVDQVESIAPPVPRVLDSSVSALAVVPLLASALGSVDRPMAVVLDNAEAITEADALAVIAELALAFPAASRFAVASRATTSLPAARLRARGRICEVGTDDLALCPDEAAALLRGAEVEADEQDVDALVRRSEGWAAGLYLAALATQGGDLRARAAVSITGDDRFVRDYLQSEVLDGLSFDEVTFLTRTSILDRMCGGLCDAVAGRTGSRQILEQLESRSLLTVPLDRRREWYRYHRLFREALRAELGRREPDLVARLHRRAARWFEANGMPETAIDHAMSADDEDRVAALVLTEMQPVWASGRVDTVISWMSWLEGRTAAEHFSGVAAHGALIMALQGRPAEAERWAAAAERGSTTGELPDGNTTSATLAYLRALLCRRGIAQMRIDAQLALDELDPASPYRATMLHTQGVAHLLDGDLDCADPLLAHAFDVAGDTGAVPLLPVVLAERGILAIKRDDWSEAGAFADRALDHVRDGSLDRYWSNALVYAFAARCAIHRGDIPNGRAHVARAARLRPLLGAALPVVSCQALVEMARCSMTLGDAEGARASLRQVHDIFLQRPGLGDLPAEARELRARLDNGLGTMRGASSLTAAELRLLPLLATHLTLDEIGDRFSLKRTTVKTQALAIYRKFGVGSRREAISRMHELGLLPHA